MTTEQRGAESVSNTTVLSAEPIPDSIDPGPRSGVPCGGQWSVLRYTMPINPIHVGLMRTGKILVVSGSSNDPTVTTNTAAVYDPNAGGINVQTVPWDLFCNGLSFMPDGRALIAGGNVGY